MRERKFSPYKKRNGSPPYVYINIYYPPLPKKKNNPLTKKESKSIHFFSLQSIICYQDMYLYHQYTESLAITKKSGKF